jgi:hypothetical protein
MPREIRFDQTDQSFDTTTSSGGNGLLGMVLETCAPHRVPRHTEVDSKSGAVLARTLGNTEFADRVAFVDITDPRRTVTEIERSFAARNPGSWRR